MSRDAAASLITRIAEATAGTRRAVSDETVAPASVAGTMPKISFNHVSGSTRDLVSGSGLRVKGHMPPEWRLRAHLGS